ncbi:MAG: cytochrome P450 [Vulcanimicrobiota bacterium]
MSKPDGPRNRYPGDLFRRLTKDQLGFLEQVVAAYPDACRLQMFGREVWILSQPELVEKLLTGHHQQFEKGRALQHTRVLLGNGLLTAEGDDHLHQRRLVQPAFRRQRIAGYADTMVECAQRLAVELEGQVDIHRVMMDLALGIVSRTLLGTDLEHEHRRIGRALEQALGQFQLTTMPFFPLLRHLPLPSVRRFDQARRELDEVVESILEAHRQGRASQDSLVALLAEVEPTRVRDEVMTMLLAGHETTANALTFAIYLLAQNPDAAANFHAEVDTVLGQRRARSDDYHDLVYTRQVVDETLRLFPPAWMVGRRSLEDLDWGTYQVPAGTILLAPQWLLHRDARYFDRPTEFVPERWAQGSPARYAYFPFGGGTRICIGEGFARMEAVLVLATLAQKVRFEVPDHKLELKAGITLRPRHGLRVRVSPRRVLTRT